jgi:hypothetical protein
MKYAFLIYGDEKAFASMSAADLGAMHEAHGVLNDKLNAKNARLGGEQLQATAMATTVRNSNGKSLVTDGPFAETTEHLGGFYLIEAADLDEALGYAKMVPGTVEVRPIQEWVR